MPVVLESAIKVINIMGQIRYIGTEKSKNGLNTVYDELGRSVAHCKLENALQFGYKEIN